MPQPDATAAATGASTTAVAALAARLELALGDGYAVERPLGAGGFAVVFRVRDLALKRDLAVKVLSPDVIASHAALERFRREAETVAQLSHPNIVPLHFIGQREDLLWLAMPCVGGGSIADRIAREGRLPVDDAVRIGREVAAALAHAHRRGVIHRDIKPANVLIDPDSGRSLVTDFGIARTAEGATITATGVVIGTPAYLSPEQVTGEPSDHRVDLFALGVMLYEMLAGRVPFDGATPMAAMMRRLAGPPDALETIRPHVPAWLARVVDGCLAPDPAARFQAADDVVRALGGEVVSTGSGAPTAARVAAGVSRTARAPRLTSAALAVVGLAALGGGAWWLARPGVTSVGAKAAATVPSAADTSLVSIAAGDYMIGADDGPALARPRHRVHVDAFRIERTEVTVGAYAEYVRATSAPAPWGATMPAPTVPVTRVPWGDAANYCAWRYRDGRLPREEEWEAAARGTEGRAFPWGATTDVARANTASARRAGPAPVGSFPRGATPAGVQDLVGNVWEWTSSSLAAYPGGAPLADSLASYRVIRGGAFDTGDAIATGSVRGYLAATAAPDDLPNTGFRCVAPAR